ncbi:MAG: SufD family Fe-S cluster assembly protein [Candidatus Thalassarchaeaceae archaeon]|nr:SufD family Fe-S cluster assembly protein [Candidatus Thalassarchaeaceae archaeon]
MSGEAEYLAIPAPDRAQHLWRYTPWHRIHPTGKPEEIPSEVSSAVVSLTMLDGSEPPKGVSVSAIDGDLTRNIDSDIGGAFIRALSEESVVKIRIDDGIIIEQPLLLTVESTGSVSGIQIDVSVGANSQTELLTLIESGADWFGLMRCGTIDKSAIFNDVVVNRLGASKLLRIEQFTLLRDAQVKFGTVGSGGVQTKGDLRYILNGRGANLQVNGAILSAGNQHNDHHVEIMHEELETFSRLKWHSTCGGKSRTIGTGMLRIAHGAKGSDSAQVFNNLLLSKDAEADSIPELEVLENEVVGCGHGTASGPVDDDQMFYLKTRGFSDNGARGLLITAFLNSTLNEMGSEKIHNWLDQLISGGLSSTS